MNTFTNDFSEEVYNDSYKYETDEDFIQTVKRIVADVSRFEVDILWYNRFFESIHEFYFVPAGRIWSNAGTNLSGTSMVNCFVDGFDGDNIDSIDGIMSALSRQAKILKSEGGYGFCSDAMRPRGSYIRGIANESAGAVWLLNLWDAISSTLTKGNDQRVVSNKGKNKIRNGAQMTTMSVWHPDIEEFISVKQTPNTLTKMNMSVLVTDDFMRAVEDDSTWELIFPDYESVPNGVYESEWDGNIKKWIKSGLPVKVYKRVSANALWNKLIGSAYKRNEPAVLFIDRINDYNNLWYKEYISATNPCGEQVLPKFGSCVLGSINLVKFVNIDKRDWDFTKMREAIIIAVRFLDDVNDRTLVPFLEQRNIMKARRRIGVGFMGLGSAMMMMRYRYGSEEMLSKTKEFLEFFVYTSYKSSIDLAKEKGSFPDFDVNEYLKSKFIQSLPDDIKEDIRKYGIRNSHITSVQPTGTTSILAGIVSGGIEPVFLPTYKRSSRVPTTPDGLEIPKNVDWSSGSCTDGQSWYFSKINGEPVFTIQHNGVQYNYDRNRGLTKDTVVEDYAVSALKQFDLWNEGADWTAGIEELNIEEHMSVLELVSRYVDSSISKTVNVPSDCEYSDFKEIFSSAYKSGTIKGVTTYKINSMLSVLSSIDDSCPECGQKVSMREGCSTCDNCGWSKCST